MKKCLTTRQKTKIRNAFANNMSMNVKLNIKIIELGRLLDKILRNMMSNLGQKALLELSVPLAKDVLPKLATKETSSELDKSEGKISGQGAILTNEVGAVKSRKRINFIHSKWRYGTYY